MLNRLHYGVNVTFICTRKPKKFVRPALLPYRFIAVVWNQTCNISEACLYLFITELEMGDFVLVSGFWLLFLP